MYHSHGLQETVVKGNKTHAMSAPTDIIPHVSCNPEAPTTILLIGGAFSSPEEGWFGVIQLLPEYHILAPCFSNFTPLTLSHASEKLAELIRTSAKGGKAHVYGFSMGSQLALALADAYPNVCGSVMLSGYRRFRSEDGLGQVPLPHGLTLQSKVTEVVPGGLMRWVMNQPASQVEPTPRRISLSTEKSRFAAERPTMGRAKEMVNMLSARSSEPHRSISKIDRVLLIAATKGNWVLPTNDPLDDLQALSTAIRKARTENGLPVDVTTVQGRNLRHPWHVGNPQLCADTIKAFLTQHTLPDAFEALPPAPS